MYCETIQMSIVSMFWYKKTWPDKSNEASTSCLFYRLISISVTSIMPTRLTWLEHFCMYCETLQMSIVSMFWYKKTWPDKSHEASTSCLFFRLFSISVTSICQNFSVDSTFLYVLWDNTNVYCIDVLIQKDMTRQE